jgi:DNA-binding transcriptional ArsR family regulator
VTEQVRQQTPGEVLQRSPIREPLTEEAVDSIAAWLRVIAEPMRIRIMEILNAGPASVQGLAAELGTTHQNVSKHLGMLHRAGIVRRRKSKNHTHYELADWSGCWLIEQVGMSVAAEFDRPRPQLRNCATA